MQLLLQMIAPHQKDIMKRITFSGRIVNQMFSQMTKRFFGRRRLHAYPMRI